MSERFQVLKTQLHQSRQRLNEVLDQVGDRTETQVYADGAQWNVRHVAIHLMDAERGHINQLKGIVQGQSIIPEDFDIDRYNSRLVAKRGETTFEQARSGLESVREELLNWIDAQDEAVLDMQGRHATLRVLTIEGIIDLMSRHERMHTEDIAKTLAI